MDRRDWKGVFTAITTPFRPDRTVDYDALAPQVEWLIENGCRGVVPLGSLGEAATLTFDEKVRILEVCRGALGPDSYLVAGIAGLSTQECVALAREAARVGCDGLMVLPAYVHLGDQRETHAHFSAVIGATELPCMLYNNPIAYTVDVTPTQIKALFDQHQNLQGVKESSGDARRVTALKEVLGDRAAVFVGLDDMVVEGVRMGADGWIAGLVNALPAESVRLYELAGTDRREETRALYEAFLPLLRLDVVPKFVQLIKLVQAEVGRGTETVRPPRLELTGPERDEALTVIRKHLELLKRQSAARPKAMPVQKMA